MELNEILKLPPFTHKDDENLKGMLNYITDSNDSKYNLTKAAEECIELAEVLLKKANKQPQQQPSSKDIIDEIGDVYIRLNMITRMLWVKPEVADRIVYKANKYLKYIQEQKYNKGI